MIYQDDDRTLAQIMRDAMPKFTIAPEFAAQLLKNRIDNSPEARVARVKAFKSA